MPTRRSLLAALSIFLSALPAFSQTWVSVPSSGDWDTAANWTPATVPALATDTAVFNTSSTTAVTLNAGHLLDGITFNGGASSYLITNTVSLYLEGAGFVNNSGAAQTVLNNGSMFFEFSSSAGSVSLITKNSLSFLNDSTAGSGYLENSANLYFSNNASAGSAAITNSGTLWFQNDSTAGTAVINDSGGIVFFHDSSAANAAITNTATLYFTDNATAGGSTITSKNGSTLYFTTASSGGTARLINQAGATMDLSGHPSSLAVGSIEGAGSVRLGGSNLTTGGNGLSTGYSGIIDDGGGSGGTGGSLTKAGSGALTLSGNNTYSGGTTVNGGILAIDTNGWLGSGGVAVNAELRFINNAWAAGTPVTTRFGGATRFFGTAQGGIARFITENNGTFDISGTTASVTVGSFEGDGLHFLGSKTLVSGTNNLSTTVTGTISDGGGSGGTGGSLIKIGTGTLTLTSINTYTGGTQVVAGTLRVGDDSALGSGALTLNGGTFDTLGAYSTSRSIVLGTGGGNWAGTYDATLTGGLSGAGVLLKAGNGALTLTGANTYGGGTTVTGGSLMAGSATALGTGRVAMNAGTLQTAGGPLTIQMGNDYTQSSLATLRMGLGNAGGDAITAVGTAALNGTLQVFAYGLYTPNVGDSFSLLRAAGGVTGRFGMFLDPITGSRFLLVYQPTQVLLTAIHPSFRQLGLTPNQRSVGAALDAGYLSVELEGLALTLGTAPAASLPASYDQVSPDSLTSLYRLGFAAARDQAALVQQRLALRTVGASRRQAWNIREPLFAADLPASEERSIARGASRGKDWGVYVNGGGDLGRLTGDSNSPGYQFTLASVSAGADGRLSSDWVGGLTFGYLQGSAVLANGGKADSTGFQGGLYGQWHQDGLHAEALANGAFHSYKTQRAGYGGTALGDAGGIQYGGWLGFGYDASLGGSLIAGPFASGQYTSVRLNAFRETGSSAPLAYAAQDQSSTRSELGLRLKGSIGKSAPVITPSLSLAWEHEYGPAADSMASSLPGQTSSFAVQGPATGTDGVAARVGIDTQWSDQIFVYLQYQGRLAFTNYDSQSFAGGVQIGF